jgi:hypothetical protein
LAWQNTLISPDYPGAMRELVEQATGAPCVFALGACGDLGPRRGYTGDPEVADANGRQLGHAVLGLLASVPPPESDFHYAGPVVSGATLGIWADRPFSDERRAAAMQFSGRTHTAELPIKSLPDPAALTRELQRWEAEERAAAARSNSVGARDARARAERARRWLSRLAGLPPGELYPVSFSVHRLGDAVWITCEGEPYSAIQVDLRRRFPEFTLLFSPLAGGMQVAYLLPRDRYGLGLYQEQPSILAPGCLEALTEAIAARVEEQGRGQGSDGVTE